MKQANGEERDIKIWNIATDAIINANLEKDGFKIKDGWVNMPEALNYSAEDLYEKLLKEKEQEETQEKFEKNQFSEGEEGFTDDHTIWEKASEEKEKNEKEEQADKNQITHPEKNSFDEKSEFQKNRAERQNKAKQKMSELRNKINNQQGGETKKYGDVGKAESITDWKYLLKRETYKTETIWTQRKSIAENNFAYRLEEYDIEDEAESEVLIDVSGSVSSLLVKSFLRQLKPLLENTKLKVGFFADNVTDKFKEIKTNKDIDNIIIPNVGVGTNLDKAIRVFSKKREVNKIVFTDGKIRNSNMPKNDLKHLNIIWIVYDNNNFLPCCGKVIRVSTKTMMQNFTKTSNNEDEFTR